MKGGNNSSSIRRKSAITRAKKLLSVN